MADGRDLKPINKDGRIYLVFPTLENIGDKTAAILVPVSSYADFKESCLKADERKSIKKDDDGFDSLTLDGKDEPVFMVDRKDYVVITNDKGVAKDFTKNPKTGFGKAISKETAKAFLDQDVSIYANLEEINKKYGAQIKAVKPFIDLVLQMGGHARQRSRPN